MKTELWKWWLIWLGITGFVIVGAISEEKVINEWNKTHYSFLYDETCPAEIFDVFGMLWLIVVGYRWIMFILWNH